MHKHHGFFGIGFPALDEGGSNPRNGDFTLA